MSIESKKDINKLAIIRAETILESWWNEDTGEFQEEHDLTDGQMEELLSVPFKVVPL